MRNFAFPYFSRDIAEFWRRWHISLSRWFRDYLYFPLGGSKGRTWIKVRNTFVIFIVSGFWHGANWTFLAWGFLNALYFIPLLSLNINRNNLEKIDVHKLFPSIKDFFQIAIALFMTTMAWIFLDWTPSPRLLQSLVKSFREVSFRYQPSCAISTLLQFTAP